MYLLIISMGIYNHDGEGGNKCSTSDQYIMATRRLKVNARTRRNPFRFSDCSLKQLRTFIDDFKGLVNVYHVYLLPKLKIRNR